MWGAAEGVARAGLRETLSGAWTAVLSATRDVQRSPIRVWLVRNKRRWRHAELCGRVHTHTHAYTHVHTHAYTHTYTCRLHLAWSALTAQDDGRRVNTRRAARGRGVIVTQFLRGPGWDVCRLRLVVRTSAVPSVCQRWETFPELREALGVGVRAGCRAGSVIPGGAANS